MPGYRYSAQTPTTHYSIKVSGLNNTDEFEFPVPLDLQSDVEAHYEIGLLKAILPKSWWNVSSKLDNNQITINGTPITIPSGNHSPETLEDYIAGQLVTLVSQAAADEFKITALYYNGRATITCPAGVTLVLTTLYKVLGFPIADTIGPDETKMGSTEVDFAGEAKQMNITCNLVDGKYVRLEKLNLPIICTVTPPYTQPYSRFNAIDTPSIHWVAMAPTDLIRGINYQVINNVGELIDFHGQELEYMCSVRRSDRPEPETN
jgi:hypothetical protein